MSYLDHREQDLAGHAEAIKDLHAQRETVGQVLTKEYRGPLEESFFAIGEEKSAIIKKILKYKKRTDKEFKENMDLSNTGLAITKEKIATLAQEKPTLSHALEKYFACLKSWAEGAGISEKEAFFLQNEGLGCQTIMIRGENGEVFFAHTEEWEMDDTEKKVVTITPEWTTFIDPGEEQTEGAQAFTGYPFALPGSTFGVNRGVFQAVDSLILKPLAKPDTPASVALWLCWYLAGKIDSKDCIEALGPYSGGFALNEASAHNGEVNARTIEFAYKGLDTQKLEGEPLASSIQTNVVQDVNLRKRFGGKLPKEEREYFRDLKNTHTAIRTAWQARYQRLRELAPRMSLEALAKEMSLIPLNSKFGQTPYDFTYSTWVAVLRPDGSFEARVSAGPMIPHDERPSSITIEKPSQ